MSLKTLGLSIVIGSVFSGAKAFASSQYAVTKLNTSVRKLNDYKATLRVDSKEFAVALKKTQLLNSAIIKLKNNSKKLDELSAGRDKFKSQIVDNVAMGATVAVPIKLAVDFESSMAGVRKVLDFKNDGEFKKLSSDILKMSTIMPVTASGLAEIAAAGGSLGIAQKDILTFTKSVGIMSIAFDMSAEDAGTSMGKLMNVYGLTLNQVNGLGDTINALDADMAAKSRDIVNTVGRIGGTAKIFGLSSDAAAGLSASFLAMGVAPEVAGTGINALLTKLKTAEQQGGKFKDGLKEIGLSASGLKHAIDKDASGSLTMFLHKLAKVDKTKQMGILTNLFGAEYADDIALVVSGIEQYDKAMKISGDTTAKAGSMMKEFSIQSATTKNKLTTLINTGTSLGINLGTVLLPGLIAITNPLQKVTKKMSDLSEEHKTATTIIGGTAAGIVGVTLAISLAGYATSFAIGGLVRLSSAYTLTALAAKRAALWVGWSRIKMISATAATAALTAGQWLLNIALNANPIGLIVLGVTALIGLGVVLYNNFKPFADMMNGIGNTVGKFFGFSPELGKTSPTATNNIPANNYNRTKIPSIPAGGGRDGNNTTHSPTTNITINNPQVKSKEDIEALRKMIDKHTRDKQDKSYSSGGRR